MGKDTPINLGALSQVLGDVVQSIDGGEDISLDNIEATPVTPETEAAFKAAQEKKAQESEEDGNGGYG